MMDLATECAALNRRWGAPGRIVFRPSPMGHPIVALANQYGSCEVSLFGGQVLSYRPTGNFPVLFMPDVGFEVCEPGSEAHGGIPVCWPWFGKCGPAGARSHGFARYSRFEPCASEYSEEVSEITLRLVSSDETKKLWPHDFRLELKVSVSMKLNLTLTTVNTGPDSFSFTEGFHPYFRVSDWARASVRGVDGFSFCDARESKTFDRTWCGDLKGGPAYDHVFTAAKHEHVVLDEGLKRAIALVSRGNKKLVVWNPGAMPGGRDNLDENDARKFVCVEPATLFADEAIELAPGASHELLVAIQSVSEGGGVHARG